MAIRLVLFEAELAVMGSLLFPQHPVFRYVGSALHFEISSVGTVARNPTAIVVSSKGIRADASHRNRRAANFPWFRAKS